MKQKKNQYGATLVDEEIDRLLDSIREIPYLISLFGEKEIVCFDKGIAKLTGYSTDDILANKQLWLNTIHPADRQRVLDALARCRRQGLAFEIEYRIIDKSGSLHWVIDEGEPVFNERGQVIQIEGIITDVSGFRQVWTRGYQSHYLTI